MPPCYFLTPSSFYYAKVLYTPHFKILKCFHNKQQYSYSSTVIIHNTILFYYTVTITGKGFLE